MGCSKGALLLYCFADVSQKQIEVRSGVMGFRIVPQTWVRKLSTDIDLMFLGSSGVADEI